jgi:diguanylate cyclase
VYDPFLVAISVVIAIFASYVALDLSARLSRSAGRARWGWWLGGATAMGAGIWSMHFVGMLAFRLPGSMEYSVALVVLSVLVAIAASALALFVASRPVLPARVLLVSSLLMGSAINGMHYIGMAAMIMPYEIVWRPSLVLASIAIAVVASYVALLLAFRARHTDGAVFRWSRLSAATVMGFAIVGMHYTGMAAARFVPSADHAGAHAMSLQLQGLSAAVIAGTVFILGLALASAVIDERERLLAREQQNRQEAEAANRLKDEFLATLSHELRTPLNIILGRMQMLREALPDQERAGQMLTAIERNGSALAKLVDDLLDVSRITVGQLRLELQLVSIDDVLRATVQSIRPTAEAKGVNLLLDIEKSGLSIMADPNRLQQIFWNLLTNAVKFTGPGGQVLATARSGHDEVIVSVRDTGIGIDPAFLPYIFEPFRQGIPSSHSTGGLGLGLAIVHRLAEGHGGRATAHSDGFGRGATFTIHFPTRRLAGTGEERQAVRDAATAYN